MNGLTLNIHYVNSELFIIYSYIYMKLEDSDVKFTIMLSLTQSCDIYLYMYMCTLFCVSAC